MSDRGQSEPGKTRRRLPRWCRCRPKRIAIAVLVLGLLVVLTGWLVTSSPLTRWAVMRAIEKSVPLDASCVSVRIGRDGIVRIENLRVGGRDHPAGPILDVPVCLVDVDWSTLFSARVRVREIALDGARVRVSVDRETGALNLQPLFAMSGGGQDFDVPGVVLHEASVEFGEHDGDGFELLQKLLLDGQLRRLDGRSGFALALSERSGPMHMAGEVTPSRASLEMFGVSLGRFGPESMPASIRDVMLSMDLQGDVPSLRLDYTKETGIVARAELDNVALNVPFERDGTFSAQPKDLARMTGVVGSISVSGQGLEADLEGTIEDLSYVAHLESHDAPEGDAFTLTMATEGFLLEEHPRLVPYVPVAIEKAIEDFSRPTGRIDAIIEIAGVVAPDGKFRSVELQSGLVRVHEMRASHVQFPYEIQGISGELRFDAEGAELVDFRGQGASGATATLSGTISPLTENATLRLEASLQGVSIDEHLRKAFGEERAGLLDELFSEARLRELRAKSLDEGLETFSLGATTDLDLTIVSGPAETSFSSTMRIEKAGMLPDRFPLPFYAEGLVIDASTELVEIRSGRFTSLSGDEVDLSGRVEIARGEDGAIAFDPRLDVIVRGARSTPQVMWAISQAGEPHTRQRPWTGRMIQELGLDGRFDAEVAVMRRESGSIGYTAEVRGEGATMTPTGHPEAGELRVTDITGRVVADEYHVEIDAQGRSGEAMVDSKTTVLFGGAEPRVDSRTIATGADLELPVEQVIGAFARGAARSVEGLRERRQPTGIADIDTHIVLQTASDDPTVRVQLTNARNMEFNESLGRVSIDHSEGSVTWSTREAIDFESFASDVAVDGRDQGGITLDGVLDLSEPTPNFDLVIEASGLRVGAALARDAIARGLDAQTQQRVESLELAGLTDASLILRKESGGEAAARGTLRPSRVSFRKGDRRYRIDEMSGEIDFDARGLIVRDVRGTLEDWQIETRGSLLRDERGVELTGELFSSGPALTDAVLGVLSEGAIETAKAIRLQGGGPGSLEITQIRARFDDQGALQELAIDGRAELADASLSAAVDIQQADIACEYAIRRDQNDDLRISAILSAPELLVEGIRSSDAYVRIQSRDGGSLWLPEFSASSHGGRFAGSAIFEGIGTDDPAQYSLVLRLGEMEVAPLLDDLANGDKPPEGEQHGLPDRGVLFGELTLTGEIGDLESQRGRGGARIFGGRVVDLPLLLQLVRVANLQLPSNEVVDLAVASFYFDGPRVVFEDLSAFAGPVEIFGFGTMTMPDLSLDLRFVPRSASPIPVVGALLESINRELMTARVRGTVRDRQVAAEPLRGTFSLIGRVTGAQSEEDLLLERVERQAERSRSRLLRMTDRARSLSSKVGTEVGGIEP